MGTVEKEQTVSQPQLHHAAPVPPLTDAEVRALAVLGAGHTYDTAARELGISGRTIRRRVRDVCDRIGVDTTIQAVTWAAKHHLI